MSEPATRTRLLRANIIATVAISVVAVTAPALPMSNTSFIPGRPGEMRQRGAQWKREVNRHRRGGR